MERDGFVTSPLIAYPDESTPEPVGKEEEEEEEEEKPRGLSLGAATAQLCLAVCGTGTLAIPSVVAANGIVVSMTCLAAMGCVAALSMLLLLRVPSTSYKELARLVAGTAGQHVMEAIIVGAVFLNLTSFAVVLCNCFAALFSLYGLPPAMLWVTQLSAAAWFLFVLVPLSVPPRLAALRYAPLAGLFSLCLLLCVLVYEAVVAPPQLHALPASQTPMGSVLNAFVALSIFSNALIFQLNLEGVFAELVDPTPRRKMFVALVPVAYACSVYAAVGVASYVAFGDTTQSDVLQNLHANAAATTVALLAFLITASGSWSMGFVPLRSNLMTLLAVFRRPPTPIVPSLVWRVVLAVVVCGAAYGLAASQVHLSMVLSLAGSTVDVCFSVVFPSLFYLLLVRRFPLVLWCACALLLGCMLCGLGLYSSIVVPMRPLPPSHNTSPTNGTVDVFVFVDE